MVNKCEERKQRTRDIFDHGVQSIVLMSVTAKIYSIQSYGLYITIYV